MHSICEFPVSELVQRIAIGTLFEKEAQDFQGRAKLPPRFCDLLMREGIPSRT